MQEKKEKNFGVRRKAGIEIKIVAMRKDEASQENSVLHFRIKKLEAEVEHLQSRFLKADLKKGFMSPL
jgi:hypothetical protein